MSNALDDIDTDISNYDTNDLISLFKITPALSPGDLARAQKVEKTIRTKCNNPALTDVFSKGYVLLDAIRNHRTFLSITDPFHLPDPKHDDEIIAKLKSGDTLNQLLQVVMSQGTDRLDTMTTIRGLVQPPVERKEPEQPPKSHPQDPCSPRRFMNTFNNLAVKGNVNSMRREIQRTNVHINSCFRERYYDSNPSDYRYQLPNGTLQNVLSMKLASVEIPNSWFLFSHLKGNNKFIVEVTHCGKCSVNHVIVPDGNYDRDSLVAYLNTKYFADSQDEKSPLRYIRICIEPTTNRTKFELTDCAPSDFVFSLHFTEDDTDNMLETMGWILGFRLARYIKIQDAIQSEGLFDGGGDRYVYLSVNDYQYSQNSTNVVCFDKMAITDNILAKIPLLNGKFSLTIDENDSNPLIKIRQYKGPVNIGKLDIKLLDRFGNIINLNFMDWSFSLEMEILYDNTLCA